MSERIVVMLFARTSLIATVGTRTVTTSGCERRKHERGSVALVRAGKDDDFGASGESEWMEKARASANKRAAEFRKDRGAQPGAQQTSRRYTRAGREQDRARTARVRGYEMDEDGNWVAPEPSVDELLRGTAWQMDPTQDSTQFSMTREEWKAVKAEARTATYPHDAVAIFERAGLRRISPEMAASMLKVIAQKAQHSRCDREELAGIRRDPRVAHMIGTCVAAARSKSDLLPAEEVAKCCWALGVIAGERANSAELEVLSNRAAELMDKLSADEIADISWSLAISRHASDRFFHELDVHAAMHGLKGFQAYQITTVAWAFAHLGHAHAGFLDGIDVWVTKAPARNKDMSREEAAQAQVHRFNATILASLAWSFSVMEDSLDSLFFRTLWSEIISRGEHDAQVVHEREVAHNAADPEHAHHNANVFGPWKGRQLNQLHQACLTTVKAGFEPLPADLGAAADEAWNSQHRPPVVSWFQRDVGAILSYMGEKYEEEAIVGGYRCDILLANAKPNGVVIEVDGPSHFTRNDRSRALGQTRLKQRQLEAQGLAVFSIPIFGWDYLEDAQQKSDYLRAGLDAIERGERPPSVDVDVDFDGEGAGGESWDRRPMGTMGDFKN